MGQRGFNACGVLIGDGVYVYGPRSSPADARARALDVDTIPCGQSSWRRAGPDRGCTRDPEVVQPGTDGRWLAAECVGEDVEVVSGLVGLPQGFIPGPAITGRAAVCGDAAGPPRPCGLTLTTEDAPAQALGVARSGAGSFCLLGSDGFAELQGYLGCWPWSPSPG